MIFTSGPQPRALAALDRPKVYGKFRGTVILADHHTVTANRLDRGVIQKYLTLVSVPVSSEWIHHVLPDTAGP